MRKLLFVAALTAVFPLNALADDIKPLPRTMADQGSTALPLQADDLAIGDLGAAGASDTFTSPVLTLRQDEQAASGPIYGVDWDSFEKTHSLLTSRTLAELQADQRRDTDTNLALNDPESDGDLLAYKGGEPREIKIGTIGTPTKHKTVADFKLSGPNAVEVTFSFFF